MIRRLLHKRRMRTAQRLFPKLLFKVLPDIAINYATGHVTYGANTWLVYEWDANGITCYLHPESTPEAGMVLGLLLGRLMPTTSEARISIEHPAFTSSQMTFSYEGDDDDTKYH